MIKNLTEIERGIPVVITEINVRDQDVKNLLFTLGCFKGEKITVISVLAGNYIIHIKDARYSIDAELAKAIKVDYPL